MDLMSDRDSTEAIPAYFSIGASRITNMNFTGTRKMMMACGMARLQGCPFCTYALNNCKTRLLVLPHLSLQEPGSGYMEPPLRHHPGLLKLITSARIYLLSKLPTEVSTCHRCTRTDWCKESSCETCRDWGEDLCETSGFNCAFCNCSSCLHSPGNAILQVITVLVMLVNLCQEKP